MSEKLKDASKAAHEIVEVLEDGDAIRNDGVRLTAANKNSWYVLATIYGEQEENAKPWNINTELAEKNRRAWNGWFCADLSEQERKVRAEKTGQEVAELMPLGKDVLTDITKRFRKRLNEKNAELPDRTENIDFSQVYFSRHLKLEKFAFEKFCDFRSAAFRGSAYFGSATFSGSACFRSATFSGFADFGSATFSDYADFRSAAFRGSAGFRSATFSGSAYFGSATFSGVTDFRSTTFSGSAYFSSTTFSGSAYFGSATFSGVTDFSSAKFKSTTRYTDARFLTHVPEFHAAEIYEDTVFPARSKDSGHWPPLTGKGIMPAADQKRAYNRLRLFMNKSLQIDEEQFFHRQEMRCKTRLASWYHKPLYWLYGGLSDFGNSVWRPLFWMIFVMLSGAVFMLWWQEASGFDWTLGLLGEDDPLAKPREAFGWSVSNTLPFLGSGKYFTDPEFTTKLSAWLKFTGWVQTLLGYILLFFLGLGLRNRFRLR